MIADCERLNDWRQFWALVPTWTARETACLVCDQEPNTSDPEVHEDVRKIEFLIDRAVECGHLSNPILPAEALQWLRIQNLLLCNLKWVDEICVTRPAGEMITINNQLRKQISRLKRRLSRTAVPTGKSKRTYYKVFYALSLKDRRVGNDGGRLNPKEIFEAVNASGLKLSLKTVQTLFTEVNDSKIQKKAKIRASKDIIVPGSAK